MCILQTLCGAEWENMYVKRIFKNCRYFRTNAFKNRYFTNAKFWYLIFWSLIKKNWVRAWQRRGTKSKLTPLSKCEWERANQFQSAHKMNFFSLTTDVFLQINTIKMKFIICMWQRYIKRIYSNLQIHEFRTT